MPMKSSYTANSYAVIKVRVILHRRSFQGSWGFSPPPKPLTTHRHKHTHLTALFPGLPRWADKTKLDFTKGRDSERQWQQLGCKQVCTLLQTDNHASTPPLSFLQAGCPSCGPTNSVKALKVTAQTLDHGQYFFSKRNQHMALTIHHDT